MLDMNGHFYGNDGGTLVSVVPGYLIYLIGSPVSIPIHQVSWRGCRRHRHRLLWEGLQHRRRGWRYPGTLWTSPWKSPRYAKIKVNGPAIFHANVHSMSIALKLKFKTNRNQFISVSLMNCKGERWIICYFAAGSRRSLMARFYRSCYIWLTKQVSSTMAPTRPACALRLRVNLRGRLCVRQGAILKCHMNALVGCSI